MNDKTIMIKAVGTYLCPGCMNGNHPQSCDKAKIAEKGCANHYAATHMNGVGRIALGLPHGFNRFGPCSDTQTNIEIFESIEDMLTLEPNLKSIYSVPVWMHLDENGNTIMRWYSPRTNYGWSVIILGDCRAQFAGKAIEITQENLDFMD